MTLEPLMCVHHVQQKQCCWNQLGPQHVQHSVAIAVGFTTFPETVMLETLTFPTIIGPASSS